MKNSQTRYTWMTALLFLVLLGFFSNMAQNAWGLHLVAWCYRILSFLLLLEAFEMHPGSKKIKWLIFPWWALHFLFYFPLSEIIYQSEWVFVISAAFLPLTSVVVLMFPAKKQQGFLFPLLLSMLLMSLAAKFQHIPFASPLLVTGNLVFIYFLVRSFSFVTLKSLDGLLPKSLHVLAFLFMGTGIMGIMFKTQHWPGGDFIRFTAMSLMCITWILLLLLYVISKRNISDFPLFAPMIFHVFVCLSVVGFWSFGRLLNIAPGLYSNAIPPKMEEYRANQDHFTKEGMEMEERQATFEKNLDAFVEEIEKE